MNTTQNRFRFYRRRLLALLGCPALPEPVQADIEPTVRCNLRCPSCQHSRWSRNVPDMPLTLFRHVLDSFPDLRNIKLQGMGEPLLNRHCIAMITEAAGRNIAVKIYTNGTQFSPENIEALVGSGVQEVFVSCDHHHPETLRKMRPGLDFTDYMRGVSAFTRQAAGSRISVAAWALASRELLDDFDTFRQFVQYLGLSRLYVQCAITSWGANQTVENFPSLEEKNSVKNGIETTFLHTNLFSRETPCPWPFYHTYISAEGKVLPCCILSDPARRPLGDLTRIPFHRIWNSRRYFDFRKAISSGNIWEECRNCYRKRMPS
ncbi:MAG: radical SAM protein [Chitinispirillaceae bacterium]|nr:radical SAM protein [Chitinispirillaceae bacterium]